MAYREWRLQIGWDSDGYNILNEEPFADAESDVWDDLTDDGLHFTIGTPISSLIDPHPVAGTLNATLWNTDAKYSGTAGTLASRTRPGLFVRIQTQVSDIWRTIWAGFLDSLEPSVDANDVPIVELYATGWLERLNESFVTIAEQTNKTTSFLVEQILLNAGVPNGAIVGSGGATVPYFVATDENALDLIREIEEVEGGRLFEAFGGFLWYEPDFYDANASEVTISDNPANDELTIIDLHVERTARHIHNHVIVPWFDYGTPPDLDNPSDSGSKNVERSASIGKYGKHSFRVPTRWISSETIATNRANKYLNQFDEPIITLKISTDITLDRGSSTVHYDAIVSHVIGDKVTVRARTTSGIDLNRTFIIESIEFTLNRHEQTLIYELTQDLAAQSIWTLVGNSVPASKSKLTAGNVLK